MFGRIIYLIVSLLISSALSEYTAAPYAQWAHSHLIWTNRGQQSEQILYDLVETYQSYGIPVGAVNIDSQWSQCINNFVFNRKKFPHPEQIVQNFHKKGIKVILWATSVVNRECPQYNEGKQKGYFLNGGKTIKWWHGNGAFVDFFNPEAKAWFKGLMDRVINMGFDGWKCDGTDPMIELLRPMPYSSKLKRYVAYRQYSNEYYGTFYNYTKSKNPETLIMARPVDSYQSKLYLGYAPKYVMFSGWVGDQHNTVEGFKIAMTNIIHSASRGYLNFGFDIGGYKASQPSQKWLYLRWVQVGALLPFMENGGGGDHQPWKFDSQTIDIYRKFVLLHYDLKQYFLTTATAAYSKGKSTLQPLIKDKKIFELQPPQNLGYLLGDNFLIEPIFEENGYVEVMFPKDSNWIYFFNHKLIFKGGQTQSMGIKLEQTALFMKSNSIIPIKKQLWLVYLSAGNHHLQIIGGDYSDEVSITYGSGNLNILIERYYKSKQVQQKYANIKSVLVRFIGVDNKPTRMTINDIENVKEIEQTQYTNQFYADILLQRQVSLQGVAFAEPKLISQSQ